MDAAQMPFEISAAAWIAIVGGSVVLVALAIEQIVAYWRLVQNARDLGGELGKAIYRGDLQAARSICERSSSPVADVFIAALNKVNTPGESIHKAAERERQRLGLWIRRRLWAIGTIGAISPFVGLFGTVVGIMRAFGDIAAAGAGGFSVVAAGVGEALIATAGGIAVAVFAVILYNYFQARANRATVEVRLVVDEFLEQLDAQMKRGPGSMAPPPGRTATAERTEDVPETARINPAPSEG